MSPQRIAKYSAQSLSLKLFYGTEKIDDDIMAELFHLAEVTVVVEKMRAVQHMRVMNFIFGAECENRTVGHVAIRHLFDNDYLSDEERKAALLAQAEVRKLRDFITKTDLARINHVVVVGIGGSYLGTKAIWDALRHYENSGRTLDFISNIDSDNAAEVLKRIRLESTLVLIISKSGDTLEVRTNEELMRHAFKKAKLDARQHFIAITAKGSPLDDPASFLASFYMWDYVGGRFSVSSMVGIVPLALALGMATVEEFLHGMSEMDKVALHEDPQKNLPLLIALLTVWNRNFLAIPTVAIIPYASSLGRYSAHLQQLFMESNGKQINQQGNFIDYPTSPIYWGEPGTDSQHSFFQLLHQGSDPVSVEFIGFNRPQADFDEEIRGSLSQEKLLANLIAQSLGLAIGRHDSNPNKKIKGDRPNRILLAEKLDARTMGHLLALHEHIAVFFGFLVNINSFDQEGVQLGKKLAVKIVELFKNKKTKRPQPTDPDSMLSLTLIEKFQQSEDIK